MSIFDKIECPYCGHEHDMSYYEFDGNNEMDIECQNEECKKEFEVEIDWIPNYYASTINYYKCAKCGTKERDSDMIRQGEDTYLCRSCYCKQELERINKSKENK
nr:MAG: zinc-ribbon domain protein [Bacteriophage sp.]